ncbi:TonB-dependent receptor [Longimicrobium terrae]|uniref:TonB-dependent transporter Oar-like beta-barrel domain-containing protein n=1 Tax=Longimicrobium terrae TaxID=1639882 RepID=A0A841GYI3_9BACT|nr:carboxypeptidase-like regulatory domain-containing protein [Longimicrobium terrae]MBB4636672.1 hypothetical protein [Longimicrobium terrae]MBB6070804.1 hypothetical protein [Longimicrobium terrae]NNC28830.1 carboxypeptidase regulatory-like domain-containing protein [Longimicrobium terrae]
MNVPGRLSRFWAGAVLVCALVLLSTPALGQRRVWLAGRLSGPDGTPARVARVQVTNDGGVTVAAETDTLGGYRVQLPVPSGHFLISVDAPGHEPATRVIADPGAGSEGVTADFILAVRTVGLEPVRVVVARLTVAGATQWTPGSVDQSRLGVTLRTEPLGTDPLSDATDRQVGMSRVPAEGGTGFSIAGQSPDQTRLTMDGADLGNAAVPREAIRSADVVTNTYDVARGRFTGGQVEVRTQRAGNRWGATVRGDRRDPRFTLGGSGPQLRMSHVGMDAGGGGALVRDRLFVFGAASTRRTAEPNSSLGTLDPAGLALLGIDADSARRFLQVTRTIRPEQEGGTSTSGYASALLRLDAVLSVRHSLMLRFNGQQSSFPGANSPAAAAGTGINMRGSEFGILAQLSSGSGTLAHELNVHVASTARRWAETDRAPTGLVNVASEDGQGQTSLVTLRFAGGGFDPRDTRQRRWTISDQFVAVTSNREHRLRLGGEVGGQEDRVEAGPSRGTFTFASLSDLEVGRPASYIRSLETDPRRTSAVRTAFYADDHWRPGPFDLDYGFRLERTTFSSEAADPGIEARFGRRAGEIPSAWIFSPRLGFSIERRMPWDRGEQGSTNIQGGIGAFSGELPFAALGSALTQTGRPGTAELVCAGPAAPSPAWDAYRANPGSVPSSCADGSSVLAGAVPHATTFSRGFVFPRAWRASLHGQGLLQNGVIWSASGSWVRGFRQPVAVDRNLRSEAYFTNGAEEGRRVFVPVEAVDPATGVASIVASRRFPEFGTVREISAGGRSRTAQMTATASRFFGPLGFMGPWRAEAGYTWTAARESISPLDVPGRGNSSTASDPFQAEWAPAPYASRHALNGFAEWRMSGWLSVGLIGRASSGRPFTPMVRGDVNGDGLNNDRAFVFDPGQATERSREAEGMETLLGSAPAGVRDCLRGQIGRIAGHNSCRTAWSTSLDLNARLQFGRTIDGSSHKRTTLWLSARNVTAGLDRLLNGSAGLRGWGQPLAADNVLLQVREFDPVSRTFRYDVNSRFGQPAGASMLNRAPLAVSLQVRVVLGSDRVLASFREATIAAARRDPALETANLRLNIEQQLPNIPGEVLKRNLPDELRLSPQQAMALQSAADSIGERLGPVLDALAAQVAATGPGGAGLRQPLFQDLVRRATGLRRSGLEITRGILTQEQWVRLPSRLRTVSRTFAPYPPQRLVSPAGF